MEGLNSTNAPLGPPPPGTTSDFNQPVDWDRYHEIVATLATVATLSMVCGILRLWTRISIRQFGWDDGFAATSMILNIVMTVGFAEQIKLGIADYDWNVRALEWLESNGDLYNYWNAVGSIIFYIAYGLIKMSILFLYLRLIGHSKQALRICVFVLMGIVCVGTIGCVIAMLTMCSSPAKFFHPLSPQVQGTCQINVKIFVAQAILSVVTDVLVLVPPIPIIWNMQGSVARKLGLAINLSLGLVVSAIAIIRAVSWNRKVMYMLHDNYPGIYWAILEVNLALIAVCLPALTQLFNRQRKRARQSKGSPQVVEAGTPIESGSNRHQQRPVEKPAYEPGVLQLAGDQGFPTFRDRFEP